MHVISIMFSFFVFVMYNCICTNSFPGYRNILYMCNALLQKQIDNSVGIIMVCKKCENW